METVQIDKVMHGVRFGTGRLVNPCLHLAGLLGGVEAKHLASALFAPSAGIGTVIGSRCDPRTRDVDLVTIGPTEGLIAFEQRAVRERPDLFCERVCLASGHHRYSAMNFLASL
jgi:hypothetical protein